MSRCGHPTRKSHGIDMRNHFSRRRFLANSGLMASLPLMGMMEPTPGWGEAANPEGADGTSPFRVAVIGHTGRGEYGHDLHMAWRDIPTETARVVAIADPDEAGRTKAAQGLGVADSATLYGDWREMLEREKPEILTLCPRFIDVHKEMLLTAANVGVKGVFCEKPVCDRLCDLDEVIAACDRTGMQVVVAHQTRYSPIWAMVKTLIAANKIGNVLEIRARGKEDNRGGMEDLLVLGTHLFDMVQDVWGRPEWCFGSVRNSERDAPITRSDLRDAGDGMFQVAGDAVHAMYALKAGRMLYFDTVNDGRGGARYGLRIYGSQGIIEVGMGYMPPAYLFPHRTWSPIRGKKEWMPISSAGLNKEETIPEAKRALHWGNVAACEDLLRVLTSPEAGKYPVADIRQARTALEMIVAPIASSVMDRPVTLPLRERGNPLDLLK